MRADVCDKTSWNFHPTRSLFFLIGPAFHLFSSQEQQRSLNFLSFIEALLKYKHSQFLATDSATRHLPDGHEVNTSNWKEGRDVLSTNEQVRSRWTQRSLELLPYCYCCTLGGWIRWITSASSLVWFRFFFSKWGWLWFCNSLTTSLCPRT